MAWGSERRISGKRLAGRLAGFSCPSPPSHCGRLALGAVLVLLLGCAPVHAQTADQQLVALQAQVAALQQTVNTLTAVIQTRSDRLEVHGSSDAMLSLTQRREPGGSPFATESAILAVTTDASGRPLKSGSLSWRWVSDDPTYGYSVARLNATYIDYFDPRHPVRDDLGLRVFGGQGACFYCLNDKWSSAPGPHVVSFAHADVMLTVTDGYVRFVDQDGKPFWVQVIR